MRLPVHRASPVIPAFLLSLCLLSFAPGRAAGAIVYTIKDLGALSVANPRTVARALNDSGQVVGFSNVDNIGDRGFFFSGGVMHDLGVYPVGGYAITLPSGINNSGTIVGQAVHSTFDFSNPQAFSSNGLSYTPLGNGLAAAIDINDAGKILALQTYFQSYLMVVGSGNNWPQVRLVSGFGQLSQGDDPSWPISSINRLGLMAGSEPNPQTNWQSGVIFYGTASSSPVLDVGTEPGQTGSVLMRVNNLGQAAGYSGTHAVLFSNNTLVNLGNLGGTYNRAFGINDSGQVVGTASLASTASHAFIYQHGAMQDLNSLISPDSGWVLSEARAINNEGQIIANGIHRGQSRAALMTPIPVVVFVPGGGIRPASLRVVPSPTTRGVGIEFDRPAREVGPVGIFDAQGRLVRELVLRAGENRVTWDGTGSRGERLASGVYLVQSRIDGREYVGRAVLLR